jgi:hypothetical protein
MKSMQMKILYDTNYLTILYYLPNRIFKPQFFYGRFIKYYSGRITPEFF